MALRGTLLEKTVLLGVPLAAGAVLVVAAVMVKGTNSRPPEVVFEGKPTPRAAAPRVLDGTPPTITNSSPLPETIVDTDFSEIMITFSENIDPASLNSSTVWVWRSGGDGVFFNGNEVQITPDTIELIDATHARVVLPTGLPEDTYRVYLLGYPQPTSSTTTASSSNSSTSTTSTTTSSGFSATSTSTGQVSTATSTTATSNSSSSTNSSSTSTSNSSSTTTTATSGATSSATTSSSTTSASSNSTTSATSNSTSASSSSTSTANSTTTTGGCADNGFVSPLAGGSSSGNGYFGG